LHLVSRSVNKLVDAAHREIGWGGGGGGRGDIWVGKGAGGGGLKMGVLTLGLWPPGVG
jgi:hypothetical protein